MTGELNVVFRVSDTGFGVRFAPFSQGGARHMLEMFLIEELRRRPSGD